MEATTNSVIKKIKGDYDSITEYDELIEAWNKLYQRALDEHSDDVQFADVEKAAIAALAQAPNQRSGQIGHDISRMLHSFDYPTYLVTSTGYVAASNTSAWKVFNLYAGDSIDWLPFSLAESKKISQLIVDELKEKTDAQSNMVLRRTYTDDGNQGATIAVTTSHGSNPTALVFVITPQWKPASAKLLRQQFALTKAEAEVLINFVDGESTQEIAQRRARSHETFRAQFQSIRAKMGARNQTELLRATLSVSGFIKDIGEITQAVEHPHRRTAIILRKGGRRVELTMMGDFDGDPVVMIANAQNYTFNSDVEKDLYDANICLISICSPGCGQTDPAPTWPERFKYLYEDVEAIFDQLDINKCLMFAFNTSCNIPYR